MNNEPNYQMTVRGIKRIMTGEISNTRNALLSVSSSLGIDHEKIFYPFYLLMREFEPIESYDELESFCKAFYRMSLSEWVESL